MKILQNALHFKKAKGIKGWIFDEITDKAIIRNWPDIDAGLAEARGQWAFIYHDRYGLPEELVWNTIDDCLGRPRQSYRNILKLRQDVSFQK